jgi:hypothetical protein
MRNRNPYALDVLCHESGTHETIEMLRLHMRGHKDCVQPETGKDEVEQFRRLHLGHRVAQDQVNIGRAAHEGHEGCVLGHERSIIDQNWRFGANSIGHQREAEAPKQRTRSFIARVSPVIERNMGFH